MRRYRSLAFVGLALLAESGSLRADTTRHQVAGHSFSLDLPRGYSLQLEASPESAFTTFGFATPVRSDGTRGLIELSILDLRSGGGGRAATLDEVSAAMLGAVRRLRTNWSQAESSLELAGVEVRRIEWSGDVEVPSDRSSSKKPLVARGVMLVGLLADAAFTLQTQDVEPWAARTIPVAEEALLTFAVTTP